MIIKCSLCARRAACIAETVKGDRPACASCAEGIASTYRTLPAIGNLMDKALATARHMPGLSKGRLAQALNAAGGVKVGYAAVDRCILAGLLVATPDGRGYSVTLSALGELIVPIARPTP